MFSQFDEDIKQAAYIHVTNYCNLHCIGCYSGMTVEIKKVILKRMTYQHIYYQQYICIILGYLKGKDQGRIYDFTIRRFE